MFYTNLDRRDVCTYIVYVTQSTYISVIYCDLKAFGNRFEEWEKVMKQSRKT